MPEVPLLLVHLSSIMKSLVLCVSLIPVTCASLLMDMLLLVLGSVVSSPRTCELCRPCQCSDSSARDHLNFLQQQTFDEGFWNTWRACSVDTKV